MPNQNARKWLRESITVEKQIHDFALAMLIKAVNKSASLSSYQIRIVDMALVSLWKKMPSEEEAKKIDPFPAMSEILSLATYINSCHE